MNQYRCDNGCKHFVEKGNGQYKIKCSAMKPIPMWVHPFAVQQIEYVGCASHSDFQSGREKVLDKLDKRCEVCARGWCDNDSCRDPFNEVRGWIKELRKDGE